jgi:diguanylate cyclase (GGDEF)-like protein
MKEADRASGDAFNEVWQGPAIVGLTHYFADPDVERRFLSAMVASNQRRLLFLVGVGAFLTLLSITATVLHLVPDQPAADSLLPRVVQLGLCGAGALAVLRARSPRVIEIMAFAFALIFMVMRCIMIGRLPPDASAALMVGGLAFLYFGLPLRLPILAPLMAVISGAMLAAWFARHPSPSSIMSVVEWVWVVNLLGLVAVRTMRLVLRQQWSQSQALRHMATHDGLTGIANRQYFDRALSREWRRCHADGTPISMILVDVDHFKLLNDSIGHPAGDSCLRDLAIILENSALRPADLVARTGGEEFSILLPDTAERGARVTANRIAAALANAAMAHPASPLGPFVTASLGVATAHPREGFSAWELCALADRLVYRAKQDGRNRIRQESLGEGATAADFGSGGDAATPRSVYGDLPVESGTVRV